MEDWILRMIERFGYLGVSLLIAAENVFPPIPSEVILAFGGFMTGRTGMTIFGVAYFATIGSLAGASLLYRIGAAIGGRRVSRLSGRMLGIPARDTGKAAGWFARYGGKAVFFCHMVPLVRSLISIPAGMSGMPFGRFLLLTGAGAFLWNLVLTAAGAALGSAWEEVLAVLDAYSLLAAAALGCALLAGFFLLWRRRRSRRE